MSGVPSDQLQRVADQANVRKSQGYFGRAESGDKRACSLFARLVGCDLNPSGKASDYGWLSKVPPESNEDGYADDALCYTADPSNLLNVVDLINGAGAPGATIPARIDAPKERRSTNLWVKPQPLTAEELSYLMSGGSPQPPQPPQPTIPSYEAMGGDEGGKKVTRLMEADYKTAGKAGLDGDSGAWQWRTAYDFIGGKFKTIEASIAQHQPEWRASLNAERAGNGLPPIVW